MVARRLHVSGTTALTLAAESADRARGRSKTPWAELWPHGEYTPIAAETNRQDRPPATQDRR
jgi:hypothetical protein